MRGELETETDCYILTQSSSDHSSTSFASWLDCSTVGHWRPQALSLQADSHAGILSPTDSNCNWNSNWLTQAVCGTWLYDCLTSTCFLWAYASAPNSTTSTGQGDIPISSTGCTCFAVLLLIYTGASLDWRLGRGSVCYKRIVISLLAEVAAYIFLTWVKFMEKPINILFYCFQSSLYERHHSIPQKTFSANDCLWGGEF